MLVHEDFHAQIARQRRDEAERIAIRMGFHSAFVRATAAESVAADQARLRAAPGPGPVVRGLLRIVRRRRTGRLAAGCSA